MDEAYVAPIGKSDVGLLRRNLQMAAHTRRLLLSCFEPKGKFVDYGGGYGVFVRLMRDEGFDFHRYDPLCNNLFAEGFDATAGTSYALLTAWEVLEHLKNPLAEIERMLSFSRNWLFSTLLLANPPKPLNDWWYYSLEGGQHISFYTVESLRIIARRFDLKLHYSNGAIHFIGDPNLNPIGIKAAFDRRFRWLQRIISKPAPPSLVHSDYYVVTGRHLQ